LVIFSIIFNREGEFKIRLSCLAGKQQKEILLNGLAERFGNCLQEKNCTLIRFDIIEGLRKLYDKETDETVKQKALELIETEEDLKYRKKYAAVWRK
jgi:hypothetical protein